MRMYPCTLKYLDWNGLVNSVELDQTAPTEQSDLALHCLNIV